MSSELRVRPSPSVSQLRSYSLGDSLNKLTGNLQSKTQRLHTFIGNVERQPSRAVTAVFALITGTFRLIAGDPTGLIALAGAHEIVNLNAKAPTDLDGALRDIHADVDMVGALVQTHKERHRVIGDNLEIIKGDVNTLFEKLDAVRIFNTHGLKELQQKRKVAYSLHKEAIEQYKKAEKLFIEAQIDSQHSQAIFEDCAAFFNEYFEIARDPAIPAEKRIALLERAAEKAFAACQRGQAKLTAVDLKFQEAFSALLQAHATKEKAMLEMGQVVEHAENIFTAQRDMAEHSSKVRAVVESTQRELHSANEEIQNILQLLQSLKNEIIRVKEIAKGKYDTGDLVAGIIASMLTPAGPLGKIATAMAVAKGWHHRETICTASQWVVGSRVHTSLPLRRGELLRLDFDETSSGYVGSFRGQRSYTVGNLNVNLDDRERPIVLRFNLNEEYPVAKEDLLSLFEKMAEKLQNRTLTPERCQNIISSLYNVYIDRGDQHEEQVGIIHRDDITRGVVNRLLKLCEK